MTNETQIPDGVVSVVGVSRSKNSRLRRTYMVWVNMRQRCRNKNNPEFPNYGGRGIGICDEWESFKAFVNDMGLKPDGLSIERNNNDANYCKSNCTWATQLEQCHNQRKNVTITFDGVTLPISEWSRRTCIPKTTINYRLKIGLRPELVLSNGNLNYGNRPAMSID